MRKLISNNFNQDGWHYPFEKLQENISFIGTGEKANNLEVFYPKRLANRILGWVMLLPLKKHNKP